MRLSLKKFFSSIIVLFFIFIAFGSVYDKANSTSNNSVSTINGTKDCLVNYDWVYPSLNEPISAWKFSSDGTFNSSTKMFGGMSSWGNWKVLSPGQIQITYTRTTEGYLPSGQTLKMSSCNTVLVGSTTYSKY